MNKNKIDTRAIAKSFDSHISQKHNKRIIFSGKFGSGKTSFLKTFFEHKNETYNSFWLSPINYSVASNDDILEYIKFDLVVDLIEKHLIPKEIVKVPKGLIAWSYAKNKYGKIIDVFLTGLALIEPEAEESQSSINKAINVFTDYKEYSEALRKELQDDSQLVKNYIDLEINRKGSIFEDDIITKTIRAYIEFLKEQEKKQNVLIIDDFDRLDPEHIFRILNIFSLHNDYLNSEYENKFGFDKIILVCDIDSIEHYYYHKYGVNSNFAGYIDKFCSTKFYRFSINEMVENFCRNEIKINKLDEDSIKTLSQFLIALIKNKKITLRNLIKFSHEKDVQKFFIENGLKFNLDEYCTSCSFIKTSEIVIHNTDFPFLHGIAILTDIVGDVKKLIDICKELYEEPQFIDDYFFESVIQSLCVLSHLANNQESIEDLCFTITDRDYNHNGEEGRNKKHFEYPTADFLGGKIKINLKWNRVRKYNDVKSYFSNYTLDKPNWYVGRDGTTIGSLFNELRNILLFLDKHNISNRL